MNSMVDYVEMLIAELRYGVIDNMLSEARANMYMYPEELRFNPYHDPSNGRFTSGGGSGSGLTNNKKSNIIRGSGKNSKVNRNHYVEKVSDIDFSNEDEVNKCLLDFEAKYLNSDIEHCRVITASGEVYDIHGDRYTVDTTLLGDKLSGSINEHNHVIGESQYSFSFEDLTSSARDGSYISAAYDERYKYKMTFTHNVTEDEAYNAYHKAVDSVMNRRIFGENISDDNCQHEIISEACKLLKIKYTRCKNDLS